MTRYITTLIVLLSLGTPLLSSASPPYRQTPLTKPKAPSSNLESPPLLGFGTWNLKTELSDDDLAEHFSDDGSVVLENTVYNATGAVQHTLATGYRHIDCAKIYGNQEAVGLGIEQGLREAALSRADVWITSKLWNNAHVVKPKTLVDSVSDALLQTLKELRLDYLDLYLMHWPVGDGGKTKNEEYLEVFNANTTPQTWKAMETLVDTGFVRHIGVSNFAPAQLRDLLKHCRIKPFAHQMELHPYLPQAAWLQYHREQGIYVTAYSPLGNMNPTYGKTEDNHLDSNSFATEEDQEMNEQKKKQKGKKGKNGKYGKQGKKGKHGKHGKHSGDHSKSPPALLNHPILKSIAHKRSCTPATVALAWGMSRGTSVIPKSQHRAYIEENHVSCMLEYEDIRRLERLAEVNLTRFNDPSKSWGVHLFDGLEMSGKKGKKGKK